MRTRRDLILTAAAAALPLPSRAAVPASALSDPAEARRLNRLYADILRMNLLREPETATRLGLDRLRLAGLRGRLNDRSPDGRARTLADVRQQRAALARIDRKRLGGDFALGYEAMRFSIDLTDETGGRFRYGRPGAGAPYAVSQLDGAYLEVPDFLDTQHRVKTQADAEAYLARLEGLATAMDQECATLTADADAMGKAPPAFVIDATLGQMAAFARTPAADSTLVSSLARRAKDAQLAGDWAGRASAIYDGKVVPALKRQMALLQAMKPRANPEPGVANLPDGEAYYAASLKSWTTADMTPAEAHRLGLEQVSRLTAELDATFKAQGMTRGAVWERLRALFAERRFLYPNTDEGKAKLIGDLNVKVKAVQARLPAWFGTLPKAGVEIRRVPPAIEAGASSNYQAGTLDGSRPGAYYIVLRDTAEDPSWLMPTLTYHEAIPGHHLQGTLAQEANLPDLRRTTWFAGYGEGWALYAEQLADEMGLYEGDPWGRIGYLHDALLRAARMVMDTGLHSQGWSRERAIRYFVENQGDPDSTAKAEVERYCVWPGQACSYMVGKLEWLRLRTKAKAALGGRFDIRKFHDAGLLHGALPLTVLGRAIDGYVAREQA